VCAFNSVLQVTRGLKAFRWVMSSGENAGSGDAGGCENSGNAEGSADAGSADATAGATAGATCSSPTPSSASPFPAPAEDHDARRVIRDTYRTLWRGEDVPSTVPFAEALFPDRDEGEQHDARDVLRILCDTFVGLRVVHQESAVQRWGGQPEPSARERTGFLVLHPSAGSVLQCLQEYFVKGGQVELDGNPAMKRYHLLPPLPAGLLVCVNR
jgi:hypothetical protein